MLDTVILDKLERLNKLLRDLGKVAVAFSAGVDSTFLLKAAVEALGIENVMAITGRSESLTSEELAAAEETAAQLGAEHVVLDTTELSNPDYARNSPDRCYHCKGELFDQAQKYLRDRGARHVLVTGTNADDLGDYRPGTRAAEERGVLAPAADVGLTKAELRALSKEWGLPTFDKPASPCLASRLPYGEAVTAEKLRMVEAAERFLRSEGLREFRVRHHGNLARIEVQPEQIAELAAPDRRARIDAHLRELGYQYVALDLRGFRSGSLNEVLGLDQDGPVIQ